MTEHEQQGAWGDGLATVAEPDGRVLDTWFPGPALGAPDPRASAGTRELEPGESAPELADATGRDERRGVRTVAVRTVLRSLADPPADPHDAYLRLHLLSHR